MGYDSDGVSDPGHCFWRPWNLSTLCVANNSAVKSTGEGLSWRIEYHVLDIFTRCPPEVWIHCSKC